MRKLTLASILPENRRAEAHLSWAVLWDVRLGCRRATRCAQRHAGVKTAGRYKLKEPAAGDAGAEGALAHGANAAKPSNCGEPAAANGEWTGALDLSGNGRGRVMNRTPCKLKEPASRLPRTLGRTGALAYGANAAQLW